MSYQDGERGRVHWQLHLSPGRVTSGERGREERRERMGERQRMQHVLISANKGVVSFFSPLFCLRVPKGERGVGFLRCFCPVAGRMAFWETWVGRWRSDQQHQMSQCFLHWCLLFVYLQNEGHGHLSLYLLSPCVLPTALSIVFLLCFLN